MTHPGETPNQTVSMNPNPAGSHSLTLLTISPKWEEGYHCGSVAMACNPRECDSGAYYNCEQCQLSLDFVSLVTFFLLPTAVLNLVW